MVSLGPPAAEIHYEAYSAASIERDGRAAHAFDKNVRRSKASRRLLR